jgi:preprotein translocase subunit SecA
MNEQRRIVYAYRDQVLEGREMGDTAREELERVVRRTVDEYTPGDYLEDWDLDGLGTAIDALWPLELDLAALGKQQGVDREELIRLLHEDAIARYDAREEELGEELMRSLERYLLLDIIDTKWREHLYDMDYLREGIHLRGFAQLDPLIAYKNEAYDLFTDLMSGIWSKFAQMIFNVEVSIEAEGEPELPAAPTWGGGKSSTGTGGGRVTYSGGAGAAQPSALAAAAGAEAISPDGYTDAGSGNGAEGALPPVVEQRHLSEEEQIGRNDPCWCGSGKKFKKCHGS